MELTRREFLKESLATLGFLALPGGLYAAPAGWKPKKRPNLVFGAVSDTHVRSDYDGVSRCWRFPLKYFRGALEWFKDSNVDAVVHGGDFAHRGMAASMRFHAEEWREVFGKSGGPVKLFVSGNHDIEGWWYMNFGTGIFPDKNVRAKYILGADTAAKWEDIWGEKYEPVWHRVVNGYHFVGQHWGEGDWKPTDISGTIKWLMEKRRSFSLFVAHGGTSFGFTAGANDAGREDGYQPDLTSYDYGAPIDEQGRPRKEYFAYRDIIFKALGEEPPAVPDEIRAIGFPATVPRRFANLRSGLVQERAFETPPSFEVLGQNQGIVFYRTTLPAGDTATLWFEKIADYAQIYIDGRRVATADRRNGKPFVSVPERDKPVELEIVVEAMGHINFGKGMMFDRKGIVGDVRLGGIVLKNWRVATKPLAEESVVRAESTEKDAFAGGHFSATVVMDEIADTYIDMSKWNKGTLYVNGHNLGRYWKIGPQLSLYCPAPFLKKGENRIDIVELELSELQPIRGLAQPIASQSKQNTRNTANEW